jgi:tetratricopeptide (TPR) repeat protein
MLATGTLLAPEPARAQSTRPAAAVTPTDRNEIRLQLAETLLFAQRYQEAAAEYRKVLRDDPQNLQARLGLTRAYFWSGRTEQAIETLQPAVRATSDAQVLALWNDLLAASGSPALALERIEQSLQTRPNDPALLQAKARILITIGGYNPAIEILRPLHEAEPGNTEIGLDLALAYFSGDRYLEAIETAQLYQGQQGTNGRRAILLMARSELKSHRYHALNNNLAEVLRRYPDEPRGLVGLLHSWVLAPDEPSLPVSADANSVPQWCLDKLGNDPMERRLFEEPQARDWLYALIGELCSHPMTHQRQDLARGLNRLLSTRDEPAMRLARAVLDRFAGEEGRDATEEQDNPSSLALLILDSQEIDEALEPEVEHLIDRIEASGQGSSSAGEAAIGRQQILESASLLLALYADEHLIRLCDAAIDLEDATGSERSDSQNDLAVRLIRAEALALRGTDEAYDESIDAYSAIVEDAPTCTKARRGLARVYSWRRAFEESEAVYDQLLEEAPGDMVVRREAIRILGWDKQLRQSLDGYDDAIDTLGETETERIWRTRLALERDAKEAYWWRRETNAAKTYRELLSDEPDQRTTAREPANQEARFDLAQIYAANRMWEEAAEQYVELLNIDARHRRARDALYKNQLYHRPELTVRYDFMREKGRGDLVDIETCSLTEVLKQEIARRTDLSIIMRHMFHEFNEPRFAPGRIHEHQTMFRLDHRFDLKTHAYLAAGWSRLGGTEETYHFVADAAVAHEVTDWLEATVGFYRQPWRRNRATVYQGIDENKLYVRLFGEVDPWLDLWIQYGHAWLDHGEFYTAPDENFNREYLFTPSNDLNELLWGLNYRFSLFPRILQFEYKGTAWWFQKEVPTYFSPERFNFHTFRLAWRHYLNTDQYVEQKQLYYEIAGTSSVDSDGEWGWGYDVEAGWDISHHLGVQAKWSQIRSDVYDSDILWVQLVMRF